MKKILLFLLASFCVTAARAYDYAYLVLQKTDGTTVSVSTDGVTLAVDNTVTTLTVNGTTYTLTDLAYMFFAENAVNEVAIPSCGWATFCSSSPLNFTLADGLSAYTATFSDNTVTLHELTGAITAGTGVVLKGEAGTYSVPVVAASCAVSPTDNDLTGTLEAVSATDYSYALTQLDDTSVGFKLVGTGVMIPANKAYYYTQTAGSRDYYVITDGSATAIGSIEAITDDGNFYDLQGRRVSSLRKGIYIRNGKKILVK